MKMNITSCETWDLAIFISIPLELRTTHDTVVITDLHMNCCIPRLLVSIVQQELSVYGRYGASASGTANSLSVACHLQVRTSAPIRVNHGV